MSFFEGQWSWRQFIFLIHTFCFTNPNIIIHRDSWRFCTSWFNFFCHKVNVVFEISSIWETRCCSFIIKNAILGCGCVCLSIGIRFNILRIVLNLTVIFKIKFELIVSKIQTSGELGIYLQYNILTRELFKLSYVRSASWCKYNL